MQVRLIQIMAQYGGQKSADTPVTSSHQIPIDIYPSTTSEMEISTNIVFKLLAHPQRRFVIHYLLRASTAVPVSELVEQVAAWKANCPIDGLSDDDCQQTAIPLQHTHLSKLADAGVIRYEEDHQLVEVTSAATTLAPYLQLLVAQRTLK